MKSNNNQLKMTLIQGDCLKVLPTLQNESVDLVLTDPPYNIASRNTLTKRGDKIVTTFDSFGLFDNFPNKKDYLEKMFRFIKESYRILKPGGAFVSFAGKEWISLFIQYGESLGFKKRSVIAMVKRNPVPQIRRTCFVSSFELVYYLSKGKPKTFHFLGQKEMRDVFVVDTGFFKKTNHPTEKQLNIIEWFLKILTDKGDVVLDPFLGSGTTMEACLRLKRSCIGIEINPEYVKMTKKRLNWGSSLNPNIIWEFKKFENGLDNSKKYERIK